MRRYHVTTFGCQMNAHDSERIKGMLESLGLGEATSQDDADVIVLNKVSAAGPERLADARRIIRSLNPGARVIETDFCDVPLTDVFDTLHDDVPQSRAPGELAGPRSQRPQSEAMAIPMGHVGREVGLGCFR